MSDGSRLDPLALLTPDPSIKPNFFHGIWGPILGGTMGFGFGIVTNFLLRRPIFSGIPKHFVYAAIGAGAGTFMEKQQTDAFAERDAVLRRYIELHPEDFVMPERQKFADLLAPWVPVR